MKLPLLILLFVMSLLGSACDRLNFEQYRIAGGAGNADITERVKSILQEVADKTALKDSTSTSKAPDTIVFYMEPDVKNFRVDLGARVYGEDILVDLVGGFGPKLPTFEQAKQLLLPALSAEFGSKVSVPQPRIPIPH